MRNLLRFVLSGLLFFILNCLEFNFIAMKMIVRICVFFFLVPICTFAQEEARQLIAGTKFSIIPPKGFTLSTSFSGFQNLETGASIMVATIPAPADQMIAAFTTESLKTKGMTFIDKQQVDVKGGKATLVRVSQPANGTTYLKQILIFGDAKSTHMVNCIYPEAEKAKESEMRKALLSTVQDDNVKSDARGAAKFSIDESGTVGKAAENMDTYLSVFKKIAATFKQK
ncbi:MAG: hypothetical protein H7Y27_10695 [Gemmatimonadaceae bacterium]|nr:hypothetical protein [Chitinophagaceae bacterium]